MLLYQNSFISLRHQTVAERHERRSRHLEEELAKTTADNETLKKIAARGGGGGGEKESDGAKRRHEELKQKAETAEKEIATLKKHIDNLVRPKRDPVIYECIFSQSDLISQSRNYPNMH